MGRTILSAALILVFAAAVAAAVLQEQATPESQGPISWDKFREAQQNAVKSDEAGAFKEAYGYYLEYARQAAGLEHPELVAWGKNNAAYMLIKMHKQDPSVDLQPAKALLTEGLAIPEATPECKTALESNMAYVDLYLKLSEDAGDL
jgi:hypothetical protein